MRVPWYVVRGIIALLAVPALPGCHLLHIGSYCLKARGNGTRLLYTRAPGVFELAPNTKARIVMSDGTEQYGTYLGLSTPHPDTLLARIRSRSISGCDLRGTLLAGDTILVRRTNGTSVSALFLGAYPAGIRLRTTEDPSLGAIPFASITDISWCGGSRKQRAPFGETFLNGAFEFVQSVQLRTAEDTVQLPLGNVENVEYTQEYSNDVLTCILLTIGVVALATLILAGLLFLAMAAGGGNF